MNNGIYYPSTGAGFQPSSTVVTWSYFNIFFVLNIQPIRPIQPTTHHTTPNVPSLKLTYPSKIGLPKRKVVSKPPFFRDCDYDSFREGNQPINPFFRGQPEPSSVRWMALWSEEVSSSPGGGSFFGGREVVDSLIFGVEGE